MGLEQSLGYSHTAFSCHRQCFITVLSIYSGLDKEDTGGGVAGVWLVSLVKQQEQILLHRKGSLHDAVEVRLLRGSFCTSEVS